ncbi:F5/8 type C domain-containing protein [Kribbella sp. VKM Ac-2569]|uniref:CARDB domain-containing protein n=1 Tax=Kribbella sp. VKM Ac-2569 TaxID=2512220 RepID=UPI00102ACBA5|nr:CARDB domain-containing protein [Kribbella sp. VKM Ac-2569]RZT27874.1 F5/8 type C domain-containing protein [Kribbella sp. VKM Ac-2569]
MHRKTLLRLLLAALLVAAGLLSVPTAMAADLTKTLTASSSLGEYPSGNAADGNANTYWESGNNAFPQWLQADLGATKDVNQVTLKLPSSWGARIQTITVQGSANGSAFTTIVSSTAYNFSGTNVVTIAFSNTSVRYVRLTFTANTGWPAAQLSEFELAGPGGGPVEPPTGTDLAAGKPIEASSSVFGFVASNANDGNAGTYWESNGFPSTLTVKLGSNADVSSVVVKLNPDSAWGARTQSVEVLGREQSATTFTSAVARTDYQFDPSANQNTVTIPVTGRYADVRLQVFSNSGAPGGQVAELQVFGMAAPNPDLVVTSVDWSPASPSESTPITLSATVKNNGSAPGPASSLNFLLGGSVAGTASVQDLAAGASTTVTANAGTHAQGNYTVAAVADPSNAVVEQSDTNNTLQAATQLTIAQAPGPDLQVTGITTNPANPAPGMQVSFTVAVNNRGASASTASTTKLVAGTTTLNGSTASIAAGATANVAISGTWTATNGGATVTATADAGNTVDETNETNNTFTKSIVVGRGAAVPYTSYEAEAGDYIGTLLTADATRTFGHTNFATESSGRSSVRLNSSGQYVEFTSTMPTNSVVVRNSIPDSADGQGLQATISLYVNGTFKQKLTLSSRNSWLYGNTDQPEGLTNTPGGDARRLFDESHALLGTSYPAGTKFRLQRDSGDTASYYIIDLVDLEQVAPALSQPAGCTSITQYGAVPNDGVDDADAIQRAVTDDQNGVISCVWIPEGQWRQEKKILTDDPLNRGQYNQVGISNATIRGAGMWYSQLYSTIEPQNAGGINHPHEGNFGFDIDKNVQLSDIAIFGSGRIRGGDGNAEGGVGLNGRFGTGTKISNVWIEHSNVGVWVGRDYDNIPELWGPADGLEFSGMRIRDTYADGINLSNGTRNSKVFNSSFRTTGDDALAVWANKYVKDQAVDVGHDNTFTNNTVQLPWRANGIAIYGGYGNKIENNLVYDTMNYPGIMLATDHDPLPFSGTTLIANNALYRCGGVFWNEDQEFGAITLFPSNLPIPGVTIRDTEIHDSTYDGIQFKTGGGEMPNVALTNVRIDKSNNGSGILAMGGARGNANLSNVTITNSRDGDILKEPGSTFTFTGQ